MSSGDSSLPGGPAEKRRRRRTGNRLAEAGSRAQRLGVAEVVLVSVWLALVAAAIELTGRAGEKFLLGRVVELSRDVLWLAPLGQLILLAPVGAAVVLGALVLRRAPTLRIAVGALTFVVYLGLLVLPGWLAWYAAPLLAMGLAIQTARLVDARAARFERLVRRTVLPLGLLFVLVATVVSGARMLRERSAMAALNAARADAPNVILLIWDTVRARSLSLYGYERETTPNLDAFARRAVVFDRAYAASSWTLPSHAAMFTGELPHRQTSSWVTPLDGTHPTLAEVFRDAGYVTAGFVANTRYADWEHGLARGFLRYEDYIVSPGEMLRSTALGQTLLSGSGGWDRGRVARIIGYEDLPARKTADRVNADFLRWFDAQEGRPLFAFLNYFDAHQSYVPPEPFRDRFGPARARTTLLERLRAEFTRDGYWDMTPEELSAELAAYEGAIGYLDDRLGALLRELERRDALDNTIVVLVSDHGEEFKEHGGEAHGTNLYASQTHVPLVIAWEGRVPAGTRVSAPVSLRDLPATLADLADLAGGDIFPGTSLASDWAQDPAAEPTRAVLAELSPGLERRRRMQSIIVSPHQLIRNVDGSLELYDIIADPVQRRALGADTEEGRGPLLRLERLLDTLTQCTEARCCCEIAAAGDGSTAPVASRR